MVKTARPGRSGENQVDFVAPHEIDIYDVSNPNSMINTVPDWIRDRLLTKTVQELHALPEEELKKRVKPNVTLNRLRMAFWNEYEKLHKNYGRQTALNTDSIGIYRMCSGICTTSYFMSNIIRNDYFLAWITCPPADYTTAMEEALQHGIDRLREILDFPLYQVKRNSKGEEIVDKHTKEPIMIPDEKVANIILKTVALLDLRVKGTVPQKIHQVTHSQIDRRSVNVNATANSKVTVNTDLLDEKLMSIEDLDKRIEQIKQETRELINTPHFDKKEINYVNKQAMDELDEKALEYDRFDS